MSAPRIAPRYRRLLHEQFEDRRLLAIVATLTSSDPDLEEGGGGGSVEVTLTSDTPTTSDVTVTLSLPGDLTGPTSVTFATGATCEVLSVSLNAVNDTEVEGTETHTVMLNESTEYTRSTTMSVAVTVTDNDAPPTVTISATDSTAVEPGTDTGTFRISRTGATTSALDVYFTVGGSATSGSDYTAISSPTTIPAGASHVDLALAALNDTQTESAEDVILTLGTSPSSTNSYSVGTPGMATVTIDDDDAPVTLPEVTITASDSTAGEAGPDHGEFTVSRTGPTTNDLIVELGSGGTAGTTDYTALPATVTIPAGSSLVTVPVTVLGDGLVESSETVDAWIATPMSSSSSYTVGTPNSATVTITDDDVLPVVTITATDTSATEPGTDTGTFRISRTGPVTAPLDVYFSVAGTATDGIDFSSLGSTVTIPAISTFIDVTVVPNDDLVGEPTEDVVLSLIPSTLSTYSIGPASTATVDISDNEPILTITKTDGYATETTGDNGQFRITRTGDLTSPLTVNLSISGSAINGSDYMSIASSVTIPASASTLDVDIVPFDDNEIDSDVLEEIGIAIDASTGYYTSPSPPEIVFIEDNDADCGCGCPAPSGALNGAEGEPPPDTCAPAPPTITSNGGNSQASINVPENQLSVTDVNAIDPNGSTGLTYTIDGGADQSEFTIDATTGVLQFNTAPDFGKKDKFFVDIRVTDPTSLADTQSMTITITDVNEPPRFTNETVMDVSYGDDLFQRIRVGLDGKKEDVIFSTSVNHDDVRQVLHYVIVAEESNGVANSENLFKVGTDGKIRLAKDAKDAQHEEYDFTVLVRDNESPPKWDHTRVFIKFMQSVGVIADSQAVEGTNDVISYSFERFFNGDVTLQSELKVNYELWFNSTSLDRAEPNDINDSDINALQLPSPPVADRMRTWQGLTYTIKTYAVTIPAGERRSPSVTLRALDDSQAERREQVLLNVIASDIINTAAAYTPVVAPRDVAGPVDALSLQWLDIMDGIALFGKKNFVDAKKDAGIDVTNPGIHLNDIVQGGIGDCFLWPAVSALIVYDWKKLEGMFTYSTDSSTGSLADVTVRLFDAPKVASISGSMVTVKNIDTAPIVGGLAQFSATGPSYSIVSAVHDASTKTATIVLNSPPMAAAVGNTIAIRNGVNPPDNLPIGWKDFRFEPFQLVQGTDQVVR